MVNIMFKTKARKLTWYYLWNTVTTVIYDGVKRYQNCVIMQANRTQCQGPKSSSSHVLRIIQFSYD